MWFLRYVLQECYARLQLLHRPWVLPAPLPCYRHPGTLLTLLCWWVPANLPRPWALSWGSEFTPKRYWWPDSKLPNPFPTSCPGIRESGCRLLLWYLSHAQKGIRKNFLLPHGLWFLSPETLPCCSVSGAGAQAPFRAPIKLLPHCLWVFINISNQLLTWQSCISVFPFEPHHTKPLSAFSFLAGKKRQHARTRRQNPSLVARQRYKRRPLDCLPSAGDRGRTEQATQEASLTRVLWAQKQVPLGELVIRVDNDTRRNGGKK